MGKEEDLSDNVKHLNTAVRAVGYAVRAQILDAQQFMLPQRRKRAWTVLLHEGALGLTSSECEQVLDAIFNTVEKLESRAH